MAVPRNCTGSMAKVLRHSSSPQFDTPMNDGYEHPLRVAVLCVFSFQIERDQGQELIGLGWLLFFQLIFHFGKCLMT